MNKFVDNWDINENKTISGDGKGNIFKSWEEDNSADIMDPGINASSIDMECDVCEDDDDDFGISVSNIKKPSINPVNKIQEEINSDNLPPVKDINHDNMKFDFGNEEDQELKFDKESNLVIEDTLTEKKKSNSIPGAVSKDYWNQMAKKNAKTNVKGSYNWHMHLEGDPEQAMKDFNQGFSSGSDGSFSADGGSVGVSASVGGDGGGMGESLQEDYVVYENEQDLENAYDAYRNCKDLRQKEQLKKRLQIALYQTYGKVDKDKWEQISNSIEQKPKNESINSKNYKKLFEDLLYVTGFEVEPLRIGYKVHDTLDSMQDHMCKSKEELKDLLMPYIEDCFVVPVQCKSNKVLKTCKDCCDWYNSLEDKERYKECAQDIDYCDLVENHWNEI